MRARFKFLDKSFIGDISDVSQSSYQYASNRLVNITLTNEDYDYICNNYHRYGKRLYGIERIDEFSAFVTVSLNDILILTPLAELVIRTEEYEDI